MARELTPLRKQMRERGTDLKLWCYVKKLSGEDYHALRSLSNGDLKGTSKNTRAGRIRAMLEADGYVI